MEAVEEMADIQVEADEEGEATEREAKPPTPEATSAVRVRTILACHQKDAAPLRRGQGTSTAPARVQEAKGHPRTHRLGGVSNPNGRAAPFVALPTPSISESGSG